MPKQRKVHSVDIDLVAREYTLYDENVAPIRFEDGLVTHKYSKTSVGGRLIETLAVLFEGRVMEDNA